MIKNYKKFNKFVLILFIVFLISFFKINANLEVSDVLLGSNTQKRAENTSTTINIKNMGDSNITNLELTFNGNSVFNLKYNLSKSYIKPNETISLTIKGYVPLDFDAVDAKGNKKSFKISDFTINGKYENNSDYGITRSVFMEAENKLRFHSDSKIIISDVERSLRNDKGFDIKREDQIKLSIVLENRFSTSGDCEIESSDCSIEDIEVNLESTDSDVDVEEDISYGTLKPNKKLTKSITLFNIPDDLDEDEYNFYLWVTGEDENGALHGDRWEFILNLELVDDEVSITSVSLFPEEVSCEKNTKLTVTIKNTGRDDQDDVSIWVDSTKLDIMESIYDIILDSGEKTTRSLNLKIPNSIKPGLYSLLVRANINRDDETDREVILLKVSECKTNVNQTTSQQTQTSTPSLPSNSNQVNEPDINVIEIPTTQGVIYGKEKKNFIDSYEFIFLLAGILFLGIIILLILVIMLIKK